MRRRHLAGPLFLILSVFSIGTASSAYALTFANAQWLEGGVAINANKSINVEGEFLLENVLNGGAILCSALFEGTVGASGAGSITAVFALGGTTAIAELDASGSSAGLVCTGVKTCENGSEVWPVGLPFSFQLNLDTETGRFFVSGLTLAGDSLLCLFLGSSIEELCVAAANSFGEVINGATDVEGVGAIEPGGTCNGNALDTKVTTDTGLITLLAGTLTVSE